MTLMSWNVNGIRAVMKKGFMEFEEFFLINTYVPNVKSDLSRLDERQEFDVLLLQKIKLLEKTNPVILCGDMNVAHHPIDLARPKPNEGNAGYTLEKRQGMTNYIGPESCLDVPRGRGEALTGGNTGGLLSSEITFFREPTTWTGWEGNTDRRVKTQAAVCLGGVRELGMCGHFLRGNRKTSGGLSLENKELLKRNDTRKEVVAWLLTRKTSVTQDWIAERLSMGNRANVSRAVRHIGRSEENEVKKWKKAAEKMHECLH